MNEFFEYELGTKMAARSAASSTSMVFRDQDSADFFTPPAATKGMLRTLYSAPEEEFSWIPAFTAELVLYDAGSLVSVGRPRHINSAAGWVLGNDILRSNVFNFAVPFHQDFSIVPRSTTAAVPEPIVANWRAIYRSSFSESTYLRLLHLAGLGENWNGPGSRPLTSISIGRFLEFWQGVSSQAAEPELVLTVSGTLQAEWHKNSTHFLEIDFAADKHETCYFALFDGRRATIEGSAKLDDIIEICSSHRNGVALGWRADDA